MLYVESVEFRTYSQCDFAQYQCLNYDRNNANNGVVYVVLCDTETGCVETFSTADSAASFEKAMKSRNPYGYTEHQKYTYSFILTAVDKLSLQFLEFVDSIDEITFSDDDVDKKSWLRFCVYDEFKTIMEEDCYFGTDAFTLFQVICVGGGGWVGDYYYIVVDGDGSKGLRVTFTDASKARAFIAKASTIGYGPLKSHYFER